MNERSIRALEFHKIIDRLHEKADTSLGTEKIDQLKPSLDYDEVKQMQLETDEAVQILRLNRSIPFGGITDVRPLVKHSNIGGMLTAQQLLEISNTIYGSREVKRFLIDLEAEVPILKQLAEQIVSLKFLEDEINQCIDDEGQILDQASAKLHSIRATIRTLEQRIRERLENEIKTKSNQLSDAIVTIRNDRYVLPVRNEHRTTFKGIVHDQSASGQTVFMEPAAVVDMNNRLQSEKRQEKREIERILRHLSDRVASHQSELMGNVSILAQIDFVDAKAKLGYEMKAVMPYLNTDGVMKMKQARHPLIHEEEVVANDIELGNSYTSIVITGPNTGGKTVTLKMIGLCALMVQSGLQIPALDGCEMPVFKKIYADIGDEQSIEQNLSTFSSHMTNIVHILEQVDEQTLVLFDELGAGTDPQEGAALAMSILDEVVSRNARVVATTHYPELKAYAYNRTNVINASVEFDVDTLKPTYRLLIGVPGRSNAFEIAQRLGLDEAIIREAKGQMGIDSENVENMIASLERSYKQARESYEEAKQIQSESEQLLYDLKQKWNEFQRKRKQLYEQAEQKVAEEIDKAKEKAEKIVSEIKHMKTNTDFKEHKWIEARKQLDDAKMNLKEDKQRDKSAISRKPLQPGDQVKLLSINQEGTVLEKVSDDEYIIQVGVMRINVKRKDLEHVQGVTEKTSSSVTTIQRSRDHVRLELDLRGKRYEDALSSLDEYIDDALLANYSKVSIIHGKGTGALRKAVEEFCQKHPRINSYYLGKEGEGGSGVTIIELA